MSAPDLRDLFDVLGEPAALAATLPILILGVGMLGYLLADVLPGVGKARPAVFLATLVAAFVCELRVLCAEEVPGRVLYGTFHADHATALWGAIFLIGALLAWIYSLGYDRENLPYKAEHDALVLAAPAGMMLMVGAGDLVTFFVGLELLSIPLYALAAFRRARIESVEAGLKYFLLGSFSSALFLYGAALVYVASGTLMLEELSRESLSSRVGTAGLAFISVSLFFKVSVFPFHMWVPDVYQGSPTPVTALMATGTKAAAFGFLVQLVHLMPAGAGWTVSSIALVTIALGNLGALVQGDLKRMLAYSGIAHAGTVLLVVAGGLAGADGSGVTNAALYYMGAYLFTATGAFGLVSLLEARETGVLRIESLRGLSKSRPGIAAALALFMLSLGGIPLTGGFLGKWFVFEVLVREDMILVAVLAASLSVVALAYYLRVIVAMYMQPAGDQETPPGESPIAAGVATVFCCAGVVAMGVLPGLFLGLTT